MITKDSGRLVLARRTPIGPPVAGDGNAAPTVATVAVPVMFKSPEAANDWLENGSIAELERQLGENVVYLELMMSVALPRPEGRHGLATAVTVTPASTPAPAPSVG